MLEYTLLRILCFRATWAVSKIPAVSTTGHLELTQSLQQICVLLERQLEVRWGPSETSCGTRLCDPSKAPHPCVTSLSYSLLRSQSLEIWGCFSTRQLVLKYFSVPCRSSSSTSEICRSPRGPASCLWALCRCLCSSIISTPYVYSENDTLPVVSLIAAVWGQNSGHQLVDVYFRVICMTLQNPPACTV